MGKIDNFEILVISHLLRKWFDIIQSELRLSNFCADNISKYENPPSRGLKLAQTFYNSCLDESTINARGFTPLYESVKHLFGGWILLPSNSPAARSDQGSALKVEQFDLTKLFLTSFRLFGASPLCRIGVGNDQRNSSRFVIDVS